jgi:hypothetical protein
MTPAVGDRFLHARQIDGSPKAGTATPVEMIITSVRRGNVYYMRADAYDAGQAMRGTWYVAVDKFTSIVKATPTTEYDDDPDWATRSTVIPDHPAPEVQPTAQV